MRVNTGAQGRWGVLTTLALGQIPLKFKDSGMTEAKCRLKSKKKIPHTKKTTTKQQNVFPKNAAQ